jgi:hypothetical protein
MEDQYILVEETKDRMHKPGEWDHTREWGELRFRVESTIISVKPSLVVMVKPERLELDMRINFP